MPTVVAGGLPLPQVPVSDDFTDLGATSWTILCISVRDIEARRCKGSWAGTIDMQYITGAEIIIKISPQRPIARLWQPFLLVCGSLSDVMLFVSPSGLSPGLQVIV